MYNVEGTIVSLGIMQQVQYEKDGIQKVHAFFEVEAQVGDSLATYECASWHRDKLEVGKTYTLEINTTSNGDKIWKVLSGGSGQQSAPKQPVSPVSEQPRATAQPIVAPKSTPAPTKADNSEQVLKPDFARRWAEWHTHHRTAQMQATARAQMLVQLVEKGKLFIDDQEVVMIRPSTVDNWIQHYIDLYYRELEVRAPSDIYGDFIPSSGHLVKAAESLGIQLKEEGDNTSA